MTLAINIALSALQAHQRSMQITSQNIANAATPGYSRQRAELGTEVPLDVKPGQIGRGVRIEAVRRIADDLINERLRAAQSEDGRLDELSRILDDIELTFNEPGDTGFSAAVNRFFAAFQDLSNNPESNSARSSAIEELKTFTSIINGIGTSLEQQRSSAQLGMRSSVREINRLAEQLAGLNQDIRRATAGGRQPNDLLDRRDELLRNLGREVAVKVRYQDDQSVLVELDGRLLVSSTDSAEVGFEQRSETELAIVYTRDQRAISPTSGRLRALEEVSNELLPQLITDMDNIAVAVMQSFNQTHATGINHNAAVASFQGDRAIAQANLTANLDDISQLFTGVERAGIPQGLLPSFTDENGQAVARNLTINVVDEATGLAEKYTIRYEPGSTAFPESRSLQDLVNAINTGRGGGFSLYPPDAAGIPNLTAQAVLTSDGYRFSLVAEPGHTVDFSRSLDNQPASNVWTSADITAVNGTDAALANQRVSFRVNGANLEGFYIDPISRNEIAIGNVAIAAGPAAIGAFTFNFSGAPGEYVNGQTFSVDLDDTGAVTGGPLNIESTWTAGSAAVTIRGRYTGDLSMIPGQPWSMEVLQGGVVGAPASALPPLGPPMVKFTYNVGQGSGTIQESVIITLDDNFPPGSQVQIAEDVYAQFGDGTLATNQTGDINTLEFTVDGQPDEAGLLSALGIAEMFSGTSAATIQVAEALRESPTNMRVGFTRAAGDNNNILQLIDLRDTQILDNNSLNIEGFYQGKISEVAVRINQNEQLLENQEAVRISLEGRRDEVSGVSIDEEVGFLILQQQAYQAAARIVNIERENIDTLIGLLG